MAKKKKTFILDTNVVLYDPRAIFSFQEHEVVIPITLLEEVDNFKKGNEIIHFNAREFSRELDNLFKDIPFNKPAKLPSEGTVRIDTHVQLDESIRKLFWEDKPDHRILACAYHLAQQKDPSTVIIVSKDINLRMKARAIGLLAEDYETGKIKSIEELYTGKRIVENVDETLLYTLQKEKMLPPEFFL
ncbi:MAG: PIN domain-containing protein [Brevinematales bacterium]